MFEFDGSWLFQRHFRLNGLKVCHSTSGQQCTLVFEGLCGYDHVSFNAYFLEDRVVYQYVTTNLVR
jgi:hypothetical protein